MPSLRVPWIGQTDVDAAVPIRCGAASVQMVLYSRHDAAFAGGTGNRLAREIDVAADQDAIWNEVKRRSPAVAARLRGTQGTTEAEQVCDPRGSPLCWATYPDVLCDILRNGVPTTDPALPGIAAVARDVDEKDVAAAIVDSIDRGMPAVVHILKRHWVVAYGYDRRDDGEWDIHYHDPALRAKVTWNGQDALDADVEDSGRRADRPNTQTVVVVADGGTRDRSPRPVARHGRRPSRTRQAPKPISGMAQLLTDVRQQLAHRKDVLSWIDGAAAHVLPVASGPTNGHPYYLVQFVRDGPHGPVTDHVASVVVDDAGQRVRHVAIPIDGDRALAPLPPPNALSPLVPHDAIRMASEGQPTPGPLTVDDTMIWSPTNQTATRFQPLYVMRPAELSGPAAPTFFGRFDAVSRRVTVFDGLSV